MTASMAALAGDLSEKPIHDVVRSIYAGRGSGTLEISVGEQKRRLHFHDGNLVLAATHPLAKHLGDMIAQLGTGARDDVRRRCRDLVQRMAGVIAEWRSGAYRFDADPASLPKEHVGPMPTERLVMLAAVAGVDEPALLKRLGGDTAQIAARPSFRDPDALGLSPAESFLLERLAQPMRVELVLAESPVSRVETLRSLAQLRATGRLRTLGRDSSGDQSQPRALGVDGGGTDAELAARLKERFGARLGEEPLRLSKEEYRARITEILGKVGGMNAYELLRVEPSTPAETVQARYEELAMLVHPANEKAYGLAGLQSMLDMLLERATDAYLTLSDPERQRRYNESHAIELGVTGLVEATGERREAEKRELGRRSYDQALALAAQGDFHFAVELLEQAVKADRKVEYLLALSRIQAKNPRWSSRAIESCRAAMEVDPQNTDVRFQLGHLYEAAGDKLRARAQYAAAARESPPHPQAAAKLKELDGAAPTEKSAMGLFSRLFGRREKEP
jgi:tetratricopeptide (TPR) repeat protein